MPSQKRRRGKVEMIQANGEIVGAFSSAKCSKWTVSIRTEVPLQMRCPKCKRIVTVKVVLPQVQRCCKVCADKMGVPYLVPYSAPLPKGRGRKNPRTRKSGGRKR